MRRDGTMLFFITSLGLVFMAELGDKSQLLAMTFAAKYNHTKVLCGVLIAVSLLNAIAVLVGSIITSFIPISIIRAVAAFAFLVFGIINLKSGNEEENEKLFRFGPVLTVALTFFIGEFGDKTQLMTVTLSAQYNSPYSIFLGSTTGMLIADSLGILIGGTVFRKIPQNIVRIVSSSIFIFFGTMGLYNSIPSKYISPIVTVLYIIFISVVAVSVYMSGVKKDGRLKPN